MDEYEKELNSEAPAEELKEETKESSPLKEVHTMVKDAESAIADGSKTKDEAINELITALQGMLSEEDMENDVMGGLGDTGGFPLPEAE